MIVIGNGESRLLTNISCIRSSKIGCNAIHRDYAVDHLICVDRRMVREALEQGVHTVSKVYTRSDWGYNFNTIDNLYPVPELPYKGNTRPDEPFQWGSGPYAVLLSAMLSNNIKLLGFDLYSSDALVNNVYKGTYGYDEKNKTAVDPSYWIHQISKIFEYFPNNKFTIYQTDDWKLPDEWKFSNVTLDKISNISYNR